MFVRRVGCDAGARCVGGPGRGRIVVQSRTGIFRAVGHPLANPPTASDVEESVAMAEQHVARTAPQRAAIAETALSGKNSVAQMSVSDFSESFAMDLGVVLDEVGVLGRYGGSPVAALRSVCE